MSLRPSLRTSLASHQVLARELAETREQLAKVKTDLLRVILREENTAFFRHQLAALEGYLEELFLLQYITYIFYYKCSRVSFYGYICCCGVLHV